ncbi:MAG TPA: PIN domain-containing protein [Thermoanaerobaculia bacterium]|nr:PIN domain-containing protein [Thermoanaerobaculia bacterium]
MKISFVDSGVLIAAARGTPEIIARTNEILTDPERSFASSIYVRLEVLPKASYYGRDKELALYIRFFDIVCHWAPVGDSLTQEAEKVAFRSGLSALDALHIAAARAVGADELITSEKPGKPIHRVQGITVRTIYALRH